MDWTSWYGWVLGLGVLALFVFAVIRSMIKPKKYKRPKFNPWVAQQFQPKEDIDELPQVNKIENFHDPMNRENRTGERTK